MDWKRDLPTWSHPDLSRRVRQRPHEWHIQETGTGPTMLLLHGAGATTHTWRDLIRPFSKDFRIVMLDLPGHGFTRVGNRARMGLETTAEDIAALCKIEGWEPEVLVGHSAGAAVALELSGLLANSQPDAPRVVAINAALDRFEGIAGWLFPAFAKMLAMNPFVPLAFSLGGGTNIRARAIIQNTGSHLSKEGYRYYARLLNSHSHVDGTLQMMARWNTDALYARLPEIKNQCLLITGQKDKAVPPQVSDRAAEILPNAKRFELDGVGHLAHEESPELLSQIVLEYCLKTPV
ncbi:MAG: alpha/beta fold hydrolase BchO [Pseudomonadota bacterium]